MLVLGKKNYDNEKITIFEILLDKYKSEIINQYQKKLDKNNHLLQFYQVTFNCHPDFINIEELKTSFFSKIKK